MSAQKTGPIVKILKNTAKNSSRDAAVSDKTHNNISLKRKAAVVGKTMEETVKMSRVKATDHPGMFFHVFECKWTGRAMGSCASFQPWSRAMMGSSTRSKPGVVRWVPVPG